MQINVGDKVVVAKRGEDFDPNGMGHGKLWDNCWVEEMDDFAGEVLTVAGIEAHGVFFAEDPNQFGFPANVLTVIEPAVVA